MKFKQTHLTLLATAVLLAVTGLTLVAWSGNPTNDSVTGLTYSINRLSYYDTIPSQKKNAPATKSGDRDFDKELRDLEIAIEQLDDLPQNINDNIKKELEQAFKNVDFDKMRIQFEKSFSQLDMEKLNKQITESFDKINFSDMDKEMKKAFKDLPNEIDMEKFKIDMEKVKTDWKKDFNEEEFKQSMKEIEKIDFKNFDKEMAGAKKAMENLKFDLDKGSFKKDWDGMSKEIEKAKEELKSYQALVYDLEKDGLLNTKEDYKISYKDGELIINGKKQPSSVTEKYKKYFKKNITIKKEDGDMDLDSDKEFD